MAWRRSIAPTLRTRFGVEPELDDLPDHALVNIISIPEGRLVSPWILIARRILYALLLLLGVALLVYYDRRGYSEDLTFVDALY